MRCLRGEQEVGRIVAEIIAEESCTARVSARAGSWFPFPNMSMRFGQRKR